MALRDLQESFGLALQGDILVLLVNPIFYAALNGERLIVSHLCGVLWLYIVVDGDNQQFMLCIKFAYVFSSSCEVQIL